MYLKKNIPNAITCGNLLCGCLAIVHCFEGNLVLAAYLVFIATLLDFFDGFVARLLKVSSPIGKDLDSLADMVTFGVVPGIIMYKLIRGSLYFSKEGFDFLENNYFFDYLPFIIPIFSAIRLAVFNNDTRQSESFIGLPTPANAIFICSIPLIVNWNMDFNFEIYQKYALLLNPYVLYVLSCMLSFLLVAPLPLFSLKFKHFKWQGNQIRFVFLIWSLLLVVFLHFIGIALVIISYLLFSIINNLTKNKL